MGESCIVLAGGLGTRLRSAVPELPKCLAPIAGRPFLEWQLCSLSKRGIDHFVLALGYGCEQVLESLAQPWARGLSISTVIEPELLGTGGAACYAMDKAGLKEALIANGDTFISGSLEPLLKPLDLACGERMRISTVYVSDRARFGGVSVDAARHVIAFLEKGQNGAGLINAGFYRIHRSVFDGEHAAFSMESDVMPLLVAQNALYAEELRGAFIDIGVPDDYRLFNSRVIDYVQQS